MLIGLEAERRTAPGRDDIGEAVHRATKNLKSAHLVLTVNGKIPGLSLKTLTGDLTTHPHRRERQRAADIRRV